MESQKYKKFLEQQAEKNPVKIEGSLEGKSFRILWENTEDRPARDDSSDILDSLYLGKDMQETVVVDRRVASLLRDRLKGLEEENMRMRKRVKAMKLTLVALLGVVAFISVALILIYFPQIRIVL